MKKYFAYTLTLIMILLSGINMYALYHFDNTSQILQKLRDDRFMMVQMANELRQSSNDLTRFARTYAVTGEKIYKENYFSVLDIREGKKARPYYYEGIYWDLLEPIRSERHRAKEASSFETLISRLPYSKSELSMLKKSKSLSDNLVSMEVEAFALIENNSSNREEIEQINTDLATNNKAIAMLHSKRYHIEKAKIMLPIDDFMFSVSHRTALSIKTLKEKIEIDFYIFRITLLFLLLFFIIFLFWILRKNTQETLTTHQREEENSL